MPEIQLVDVMVKAPGRCGICNTTPTEGGKPKPAIDTCVDVDWGNNFYICDECANVICDLLDRVDADEVREMRRQHDELKKDHKRLLQSYKRRENEIKKIAEGKRTKRKVAA